MTTPLDDAFRALSNPERRHLLLALADHNPQSESSFDYPDDVPFEDGKDEENSHIRMYHTHLPMLAEAGFIEWHEDALTITRGPNFEVVQSLVQTLDQPTSRVGATDAP